MNIAEPPSYSGPITITTGGTYRGNWQTGVDGSGNIIPAVRITTQDPVIIEYSHLTGPGNLLVASAYSNVTVRNCCFHGKPTPNPALERGRAIDAAVFKNLVVENNFFENTSVVVATSEYAGNATPQQNLIVRYNRVRNIIGLKSDNVTANKSIVQFVAIQNFRQTLNGTGPTSGNPKDARIAWNEVINTPGISVSEDLINFYKAGGRADGWFKVHDNYLHGSYPSLTPETDDSSGSGIITDGPDHNKCAYIEAYNNIVVNTTNAAMNIAAGSNIWYHHNRMITTGKNPAGQWMQASWAACAIWNSNLGHPEAVGTMHDNVMENNVIGWAKQYYNNPYSSRNDLSLDEFGAFKPSNVHLPNAPITQAMQDQEYQTFLQRALAAGVLIGPQAESPNVPVSNLTWVGSPVNGWGPPEKDRGNGDQGATDGPPIQIRGTTYPKGLGVHAYSEITYALNGQYNRFISNVGVDDATAGAGSVVFQVWTDGVKIYDSGTLTGTSPVQSLNISVAGKNQMKLIVTDSGDGAAWDHADWAGAELIAQSDQPPSAFSLWQVNFFDQAGLNNSAVSGPNADPDKDGVTNLFEYFFNLDPWAAVVNAGLPVLQQIGANLTLTYQKDTAKADLTASAEKSSDFVTWSTSGITDSLLSTAGTVETRRALLPVSGAPQFLRLKVSSSAASTLTGADIGGPSLPGSYNFNGAVHTLTASGNDIWNNADQFHFASKSATGDQTIIAKVTSLTATDQWAKAGVMLRNSSSADSVGALVAVTPSQGVTFQWRTSTGGATDYAPAPGVPAPTAANPVWVKLVKTGNSFTAFYSTNGTTWTQVGGVQTINFTNSPYLEGLALTSHNNSLLTTSTFTDVSLSSP